jgi:hypothetical protein
MPICYIFKRLNGTNIYLSLRCLIEKQTVLHCEVACYIYGRDIQYKQNTVPDHAHLNIMNKYL